MLRLAFLLALLVGEVRFVIFSPVTYFFPGDAFRVIPHAGQKRIPVLGPQPDGVWGGHFLSAGSGLPAIVREAASQPARESFCPRVPTGVA